LQEIDALIAADSFWNDQQKAQTILRERTKLSAPLAEWQSLNGELTEQLEFYELASGEADEGLLAELVKSTTSLRQRYEQLELRCMLSGDLDENSAIVNINAGAGGTEACDWASMLLRMYLHWAEDRGFSSDILDQLNGDEAGIKNTTISIEGPYAYGFLKSEIGIHRLVRISPFDSNARRHTSFASVFVYPQVKDDIEVVINETELRIDTYRSHGAGGQHVNTTDSAVRITHLPTGIVVACQNERSQHKNKASALKILKARLYEHELVEREKERDAAYAQKKEIAWGSQIRSYVLQPYRLIKDHRTQFEVGDVTAVLDGRLDGFMRAYLLSNKETKR